MNCGWLVGVDVVEMICGRDNEKGGNHSGKDDGWRNNHLVKSR
jgi:hypothetical protein